MGLDTGLLEQVDTGKGWNRYRIGVEYTHDRVGIDKGNGRNRYMIGLGKIQDRVGIDIG